MREIGRYRIISELGRGATGVVYRAYDTRIGREVALKTIRLEDRAAPGEVEQVRARLIREAQSAGRLSHPGIVTIFDAGDRDGLAFVAMELVEGRRLSEYLAEGVAPADKLEFATDLLKMAGSALDYANRAGVVHRDVKPANIIVSEGKFKLLDFGVAHVSSSQLTKSGTVIGTPNYMSPEQVSGDPVDGRSDQFSLAVIVYELLTGAKPFAARSIPATLYRIVHEDPPPMRTLLPGIPRAVAEVVTRALAKDPADRFFSCGEFADAFEEAASGKSMLWAEVEISVGLGEGTETKDGTATVEETVEEPKVRAPGHRPLLPEPADVQQPADHTGLARPLPPVRTPEPTPEAQPLPPIPPPSAGPTHSSRWPQILLAMLACLIGVVTVVLVRNPGLVRDRQAIAETLLGIEDSLFTFGRELVALFEPDTADRTAASPAPVPRASSQAEYTPASETETEDPAVAAQMAAEPSHEARAVAVPAANAEAGQVAVMPVANEPRAPAPKPDTASVYFESNVEGVLVTVDDNRAWRCLTPCSLTGIPLGEHNLVAHRSGYGLQRRTIDVDSAEIQVEVLLSRPQATLVVTSSPDGARVFVDGSDTGKTTNTRIAVRAGRRQIRLVHGEVSAEETVELEIDELRHLNFKLASR